MKRILVPFDFSPQSIEALKFAVNFAKKERDGIVLLHAIEFPAIVNSSVALEFERQYMEVHRARATSSITKIARRVAKDVEVETIIDFGGPIHVIERAIESSRIDLVVMGTQGASGLKEFTIGSNTQKVARRSTVPVIAIRKSVRQIDNIIFPVPPEGEVPKEIVDFVKSLQEFFDAKLQVLFVNTPYDFGRDVKVKPALAAFCRRHQLRDCTVSVFNDRTGSEGIVNFAKGFENVMVAMGTHGRHGIRVLAFGSVAEDVVNHIDCPVATLRMK